MKVGNLWGFLISSVVFGFRGPRSYYEVRLDAMAQHRVIALARRDGKLAQLAYCDLLEHGFPVNKTWCTIEIEVVHGCVRVLIDNSVVLFYKLGRSVQAGRIGISVTRGKIILDDVMLKELKESREGDKPFARFWFLPRRAAEEMLVHIYNMSNVEGFAGGLHDIKAYLKVIYKHMVMEPKDVGSILKAISIFNVRYVVLGDYAYMLRKLPGSPLTLFYEKLVTWNVTRARQNVSYSRSVIPLYFDKYVAIVELKEHHPVWTAQQIFILDGADEEEIMEEFFRIISSGQFDLSQGLFVSRRDYKKLPAETRPWDEGLYRSRREPKAKVHIYSITMSHMQLVFRLSVSKRCYVALPVAYFPGLKIKVNGQPVSPLKVLPGFPAVKLEPGDNLIVVSREITRIEETCYVVSLIASAFTAAAMALKIIRDRRRSRGVTGR